MNMLEIELQLLIKKVANNDKSFVKYEDGCLQYGYKLIIFSQELVPSMVPYF